MPYITDCIPVYVNLLGLFSLNKTGEDISKNLCNYSSVDGGKD